jgi:hypothetical protein
VRVTWNLALRASQICEEPWVRPGPVRKFIWLIAFNAFACGKTRPSRPLAATKSRTPHHGGHTGSQSFLSVVSVGSVVNSSSSILLSSSNRNAVEVGQSPVWELQLCSLKILPEVLD